MFRHAARASSAVFLCSLRSSRRADTGTYPLLCFTVSVRSYNGVDTRNTLGFIELYEKMSVLWDPNHSKYYNKLHEHIPTTAANNWWITARSLFAGMRAVLSEPTPRVEQNSALLRYSRLLKSGRGLRHNWNQVNGKLSDSRMRTVVHRV